MVKGENISEERPYGIVELSTEQNITVPQDLYFYSKNSTEVYLAYLLMTILTELTLSPLDPHPRGHRGLIYRSSPRFIFSQEERQRGVSWTRCLMTILTELTRPSL